MIFAAVSVMAIVSLVKIDRQIETINRKWLAGTQLLGDLKNTIAEFRVTEGYRFLAADQPAVIQAEFLAERQATVVGELLARFERMAGEIDMVEDVGRFEATWREMVANHKAWIDEARGEEMTRPMGYGSSLQKRYEAVQLAANNLIEDARTAADVEVAAANKAATRATVLVIALSIAAGLLAVGLLIYAEFHVARPLGAITWALTRLADGDRSIRVPERHRRDEIGAMATAFEVFRRNAVALGEAQERAEALARHDALTGLANRRLFSTRLESTLDVTGTGTGLAGAVMLIDLDRFKPINDLHGHGVGDLVLCDVAARLRGLTGSGTLVARLGGDEFALVLSPVRDPAIAADQSARLARRIVDRLADPMSVAGITLTLGASVGISIMPVDGATAANVLRAADLAMYRAKADGRGTFRFFETAMDADLRERSALEADLRVAFDAGQIEPCYDPVVELASRRVVGYETRARWQHPVRGLVPPEIFLPVLDQLGALGRMTEALMQHAVRDAARMPGTYVAIDVPHRQVQDVAFPTILGKILLSADFPPNRLEIEVSETALEGDDTALRSSLEALRTLGVRVVLNGFGSGRASLPRLRDFRFDKIKIGQDLIAGMAQDPAGKAVLEAVLGLARDLDIAVVAADVATEAMADVLASRGCALGQGPLFRLYAATLSGPDLRRAVG